MNKQASARIGSGIVIHGGVGTIPENAMTTDMLREYKETLRESLSRGHAALTSTGNAVDAVVAAVAVMEDSPLFNAGRGSNFDERGVVTMDASLMRGLDRNAGAVAGVTGVRNPVKLAHRVMENSEHVLLIAEGADEFARQQHLEMEDAAYFHTDRRWNALQRAKTEESGARPNVLGDDAPSDDPTSRAGTVGAVALDPAGRIAAATSTGGMANKTWGRVGDSPIIAAGNYAGAACAVSCTGWGEYFIRSAVAYDVHARMVHGGATLREAVDGVIWEDLHTQVPGSGGLVAIDPHGNVELCFNTLGMYRGWIDEQGRASVGVYDAMDAPT